MFKKNTFWVILLSFVFILANAFFLYRENLLINAIPLMMLVLFVGFIYLDKLVLALVVLTPLSIPLSEVVGNIGIDMFLPTEPILFGVLLIFISKLLINGNFDRKILLHPVSLAIYANLVWLLVTSVTSTMMDVSLKFFVARLWFIVAFYFICTQIFKNFKQINKFYWLYIAALIIVIFYAWSRLAQVGFMNQKAAHWAANPFYKDHTSYGSVIAMYIPFLVGFSFSTIFPKYKRRIALFVTIIILMAIVFSYTRAAWLSLIPAIGIWIILKLKIKFKTIIGVVASILILFFTYQTQIFLKLEKNRQESASELSGHISSMSNIKSDASNLERINRWNSAIRMFKEKPVFGWGPGTYMFKYAPFQHSQEKTIISTNLGKMGNAHSEYLGPLAESGFPGMITFLLIIGFTIYTAVKVYSNSNNSEIRFFILTALLGLITYYTHGFLNNFLDTDKASVPFWGFTAMIVAIDVYHSNHKQQVKKW